MSAREDAEKEIRQENVKGFVMTPQPLPESDEAFLAASGQSDDGHLAVSLHPHHAELREDTAQDAPGASEAADNSSACLKLLHIGDLHLGRSLGDFDLADDQAFILDQILHAAQEENVHGILVAGDVYDKAIPSEAATRLLDSFLTRLADLKIPVFMISGNHDSDDRLQFGRELFTHSQIYISSKAGAMLTKQTLRVGETEADIWLLPFVKASQVRHLYPEEKIETYDDAVRTIIRHADIDPDRVNILVAHQFVTGKEKEPVFGGSESPGVRSVGLVEQICSDCFEAFAYVALGHIHSPQAVGRETIRYAGSPLKYSLSEANNEKSMPLVCVSGDGTVAVRLLPLKPRRDLRHLRGGLKDLLNPADVHDTQDFIYATLTDEEIINDAMGIVRQTYPNTVKIDYDNTHTRQVEQVDISQIAENRSFPDLIGDFYMQMYGTEISAEEMNLMREVAREAGVIHEAG